MNVRAVEAISKAKVSIVLCVCEAWMMISVVISDSIVTAIRVRRDCRRLKRACRVSESSLKVEYIEDSTFIATSSRSLIGHDIAQSMRSSDRTGGIVCGRKYSETLPPLILSSTSAVRHACRANEMIEAVDSLSARCMMLESRSFWAVVPVVLRV